MVTVKGVEVRLEELNREMNFKDLTAEGQKRIFLENKEEFVQDVLQSKYPTVRDVIWEVRNQCSAKVLNAAVVGYNESVASESHILDLLNVPGFELDEKVRELLGTHGAFFSTKLWVAKSKSTSLKILKEMFNDAAERYIRYNEVDLLDAVVSNPNFEAREMDWYERGFTLGQKEAIRERIAEVRSNG